MNNFFAGDNGFHWFTGVVEDRQDPLKTGRVRVRVIGAHTSDKTILPTADLPWASCMLAATSPGISGIGQSPAFLLEGSWVFGYFRDGAKKQEPVVLGSMPGYPTETANTLKGFYDPNGVYPTHINEPDVNRLAVNNIEKEHSSLTARKADRKTSIATADFDTDTAADGSIIAASDGGSFDQPTIPYSAIYPYNRVFESESGHILEFDDTDTKERIHLRHKVGTSIEMAGDHRTDIIKGEHYTLTTSNSNTLIEGNTNTSINGHHKLYINKSGSSDNHYDIQIGPNANINIQVDNGDINLVTKSGKVNVNSGGDYNLKVGGNMTVNVAGSINETVEGSKTSNTTGAVIHRGQTIDLNP